MRIMPEKDQLNDLIVEWTDNKTLLTGAFPDKFLFGQGVPNGLPTQQNWKHFDLYYDGWFDDPLFIAHGFNQLQPACFIQNLARITGKNLATLKSLVILANSEEFRRQLIWARDHPHSQEAKSLNAKSLEFFQWLDPQFHTVLLNMQLPVQTECYVILLWGWLKFHYWCAPWVWRFANVATLHETKIQWSKMCDFKTRIHTIRSSWSNA